MCIRFIAFTLKILISPSDHRILDQNRSIFPRKVMALRRIVDALIIFPW